LGKGDSIVKTVKNSENRKKNKTWCDILFLIEMLLRFPQGLQKSDFYSLNSGRHINGWTLIEIYKKRFPPEKGYSTDQDHPWDLTRQILGKYFDFLIERGWAERIGETNKRRYVLTEKFLKLTSSQIQEDLPHPTDFSESGKKGKRKGKRITIQITSHKRIEFEGDTPKAYNNLAILNWKSSIDRAPFYLANEGSIHRAPFCL